MSLHAGSYNSSEYNNNIPNHRIFQQRCRSRSTKMATPSTSTSTSATRPRSIPHYYNSTTAANSLVSLMKLIDHHQYIQIAKGHVAVPSSRRRRPIQPTPTFRRQLKYPGNSTSLRPSRKRTISVDINDMSPSGKKTGSRRPSIDFHMKTRCGSSQETSSQESGSSGEVLPSPIFTKDSTPATADATPPRSVTPEQTEMAPLKTPLPSKKLTMNSSARRKIGAPRSGSPGMMYTTSPLRSSPLSSPPSNLGNTPERLAEPITRPQLKEDSPSPMSRRRPTRKVTTLTGINYGSLSPEERIDLKRKAGGDDDEGDDTFTARASKRAKQSVREKSSLITRAATTLADTAKRIRKVRFAVTSSQDHKEAALSLLADTALAGLQDATDLQQHGINMATTKALSPSQESNDQPALDGIPPPKPKPGRIPKPKRMTKAQLALEIDLSRHGEYIEATIFSHEDPKNPVFYGADGVTKYVEPAEGSPAKNGKAAANTGGGVRKRKGGGGWNKGMGKGKGKGRGKGRAKINRRDDEEEDPSEGKDSTTDDHKNLVKLLKARQSSLRNFFRDIGRQQADILDSLALRDINKLSRRANTHKKVPEYDEVLKDLKERKDDAIDLAKKRFELDKKLADTQYAQEKELLEQQLRQRYQQVHAEHLSGAQGDLMLQKRQDALVVDDDRTDDGSQNQDDAYFPRYHQFPESNVRGEPLPKRGYTSNRITGERPFQIQLDASNYDDLVRREVLQSDVMGPILRSLEVANKERREADAREKTQNMMALSNVAIDKLSKIKGYLVPTRLTGAEMNSYALSVLADISEFHAQQHKDKAYRYHPLATGDTFPPNAIEHTQLPGAARLPPPPLPRFPTASAHQRTHQFVFQNPGVVPPTPRPAPAATPPVVRVVQQRFPVQFVNQTVESRKAAGNQGKGGQRVLLPKV